MTKIQTFKQELARVFDDNLHTKQWHNYVDYAIIGLIILSTVEVFLSTYDGIVEKYGIWLKVVDYFTTAFFTIEVSLRIWCADLTDDKYKGFWGRVRYCFCISSCLCRMWHSKPCELPVSCVYSVI